MHYILHPRFISFKNEISESILNFNQKGEQVYKGSRNSIKYFTLEGITINIKAFKKPNFVKKII